MMRINAEILLKLAGDTVARRARTERDLLAVYLTGSLLEPEPVLAGTADVDLRFIHHQSMPQQREIVRLTDDVHLDILHVSRDLYRQPRSLRSDPWLGAEVYGYRVLHDPQHFLDFTQASVRGQFDRPETVLQRSRRLLEVARQEWLSLQLQTGDSSPQALRTYLQALEQVANAVACLSGAPLTERRFLLRFGERAAACGRPGLTAGLMGLLGGPQAAPALLRGWLPDWRQALKSLPASSEADLQPLRLAYYLRPVEAWLENDSGAPLALWLLLRTWTHAVAEQAEDAALTAPWSAALADLGLQGETFAAKLDALDAYLDSVEETVEDWARKAGAEV
jgi:hypothetical protein